MRELVEGKNTIGRTAAVLKKPYKATFTFTSCKPLPPRNALHQSTDLLHGRSWATKRAAEPAVWSILIYSVVRRGDSSVSSVHRLEDRFRHTAGTGISGLATASTLQTTQHRIASHSNSTYSTMIPRLTKIIRSGIIR